MRGQEGVFWDWAGHPNKVAFERHKPVVSNDQTIGRYVNEEAGSLSVSLEKKKINNYLNNPLNSNSTGHLITIS